MLLRMDVVNRILKIYEKRMYFDFEFQCAFLYNLLLYFINVIKFELILFQFDGEETFISSSKFKGFKRLIYLNKTLKFETMFYRTSFILNAVLYTIFLSKKSFKKTFQKPAKKYCSKYCPENNNKYNSNK